MDEREIQSHLSRIETRWTVLRRAHAQQRDAVEAYRELVDRYQSAICRYLLASLRDVDAAEELFQEFALRLLQGRFQGADPAIGRFRAYLKTTLIRMVTDYRNRRPDAMPLDEATPLAHTAQETEVVQMNETLRNEFIARAWRALRQVPRSASPTLYEVLQHRSRHPEATSREMAASLSRDLGLEPPLQEVHFRKLLQRARQKFAELLLDEVAHSLGSDDPAELEQELIELQLRDYCRSALARRAPKPPRTQRSS